jgi:hypothetical protein
MAKASKPADPVLDDSDENVEPIGATTTEAVEAIPTKEQLDREEKAAIRAAAELKVEVAQSEVRDLEAALKSARQAAMKAEIEASNLDAPVFNPPVCLPQYDPTIRSARSSHQAQMMVEVVHRDGKKVELAE